MQIELNEEAGRCLQHNGFRDQAQALLPPSPPQQQGCFGEGFEFSNHFYLCPFIPLA
jgi:hypothetical protein